MKQNTIFWLVLTFFCIVVQGFFSMLEMAAVSFNKVRLEYYVSKGIKRAQWLEYLLKKPARLFGTVMLGVNIALQVGSQSSREFYQALGFNPDYAPITQVFLVVVIAELAPLFAARHYAEHVVMLCVPIVYFTARIFSPLIAFIGLLSKFVNRLFGMKIEDEQNFITREELQKIIENQEDIESEEFNVIVANIFTLRSKVAKQVMIPLSKISCIQANSTIAEVRKKLTEDPSPFFPLFHKKSTNIVAIAYVRDLLRLNPNKQIREFSRPPWFITDETKLIHILTQFRKNNQSITVVLNRTGEAVGILTLDRILQEIFGEVSQKNKISIYPQAVIERTFPGNMLIRDFNEYFVADLDSQGSETLAQLMFIHLGHHPEPGESIVIGRFQLIAEETSIRGTKTIIVKTT